MMKLLEGREEEREDCLLEEGRNGGIHGEIIGDGEGGSLQ